MSGAPVVAYRVRSGDYRPGSFPLRIGAAAARAKQTLWAARAFQRFEVIARGGRPGRPLCVVYGNCQAEPVRALLAASPEFANSYEAVPVPAVHEISAAQTAKLQCVLRRASLLLAQPVKDDYRGQPLGIQQLVGLAPRNCRVIRFPALYYDALYPFQVIAHDGDQIARPAPLTLYHDLRIMCAAANRLGSVAALRWISEYRPPLTAVSTAAERAAEKFRDSERAAEVGVLDCILASSQSHASSFFTVNHPARYVLLFIALRIHDMLGFARWQDHGDTREPLGVFRTPLEQPVVDALGLTCDATVDWTIKGKRVSMATLLRRHLEWYLDHPDVVRVGLKEHAAKIAALGLLV